MIARTYASICLVFILTCGIMAPALAQTPNGLAIAKKTKAALEPDVPSTRTITVHINRGSNEVIRWTGAQARDSVNGSNYIVTVMLSPPEARGLATLARQEDSRPPQMWSYIPAVHRVDMLTPTNEFAPMFGSDFTFADLGFMNLNAKYAYMGEAERDGIKTYKIQVFPANNPYYTRIVAWIRQSDFFRWKGIFMIIQTGQSKLRHTRELRMCKGFQR